MKQHLPLRSAAARRGLALGLATTMLVSLTACGPDINEEPTPSANRLQSPEGDSPSGEITIWDRSGDLYEVFDAAIDDFNEVYPDIKVNHEAVDIDAKLQNTLITGSDVPDGVFLDDAKVAGLSEYMWDLGDVLEPYVDEIAPQKIDVNSIDGGIYGGLFKTVRRRNLVGAS